MYLGTVIGVSYEICIVDCRVHHEAVSMVKIDFFVGDPFHTDANSFDCAIFLSYPLKRWSMSHIHIPVHCIIVYLLLKWSKQPVTQGNHPWVRSPDRSHIRQRKDCYHNKDLCMILPLFPRKFREFDHSFYQGKHK